MDEILILFILAFSIGLMLFLNTCFCKRVDHKKINDILNNIIIYPLSASLSKNTNYKNSKSFLEDFNKSFKNNLENIRTCLLNIIKPKDYNITEQEIIKILVNKNEETDLCISSRQISFIINFLNENKCYIDHNALFNFAKDNINDTIIGEKTFEFLPDEKIRFDIFLQNNGCCEKCGGVSCINLSSDDNNCGVCGNKCPSGYGCCNESCVDLGTVNNCGDCNRVCPTGYTCCNGSCVDLQTDIYNCGTCGNECVSGQKCFAGKCQ